VGILYVVYATGGSLGGFLSAWLVPSLGWQSIYWLCGAVALAYSLLLYLFLPESLRHMILRGRSPAKIARLAGRLDPTVALVEAEFVLPRSVARKAWVGELFAEKRGLMTVLLWAAYVCNMLALQFNTAWMPTIFASAGVSYSKSVVATSLFQGGGALGSLSIGWLMDREKGLLRLCALGLIAAPIFLIIGHSAGQAGLLMLLASMVGFCIIGSQTGINATAGFLYPTALRATGVGWAYGVGRIGSITGPILGAAMLSLHFSFPMLYLVAAIPPLLVSLFMFGVYLTQRGRPRPSSLNPESLHVEPAG
jgi:AAHS family 4-hydroxybenzoate transporter-like MFS transporter